MKLNVKKVIYQINFLNNIYIIYMSNISEISKNFYKGALLIDLNININQAIIDRYIDDNFSDFTLEILSSINENSEVIISHYGINDYLSDFINILSKNPETNIIDVDEDEVSIRFPRFDEFMETEENSYLNLLRILNILKRIFDYNVNTGRVIINVPEIDIQRSIINALANLHVQKNIYSELLNSHVREHEQIINEGLERAPGAIEMVRLQLENSLMQDLQKKILQKQAEENSKQSREDYTKKKYGTSIDEIKRRIKQSKEMEEMEREEREIAEKLEKLESPRLRYESGSDYEFEGGKKRRKTIKGGKKMKRTRKVIKNRRIKK